MNTPAGDRRKLKRRHKVSKYEFAVLASDPLMATIDAVYVQSVRDLLGSAIEGCRNLTGTDNPILADKATIARTLCAAALRELSDEG